MIDAVAGKGGGRALGADIAVLGSQELAGAFSDGPGARLAEEHVVDNRDEEAVGVGRDEAPEGGHASRGHALGAAPAHGGEGRFELDLPLEARRSLAPRG